MRVLVTAASKYGATEQIAVAIAEVLNGEGLSAEAVPIASVGSIDQYDAVVLGSGVYAGHWLKPAKDLVAMKRDQLASRPVWLFSSGPVGEPAKPEEDPVDVADVMADTKAREHKVFKGRIAKKELGFADKAIVAALRVPEGDFRDWNEVRDWAFHIANSLRAGI